jgi:hypothetical protein
LFSESIGHSTLIEVPASHQMTLLKKVLQFGVHAKKQSNGKDEVQICVLYQSGNRISNKTMNSIVAQFSKNETTNIRCLPIDVDSKTDIKNILKSKCSKANVLVITQLSSVDFMDIAAFAIKYKILTFATAAEIMLKNNFSACVGYKGNAPQLVVSLSALKAEGISLSSQILRYARVLD